MQWKWNTISVGNIAKKRPLCAIIALRCALFKIQFSQNACNLHKEITFFPFSMLLFFWWLEFSRHFRRNDLQLIRTHTQKTSNNNYIKYESRKKANKQLFYLAPFQNCISEERKKISIFTQIEKNQRNEKLWFIQMKLAHIFGSKTRKKTIKFNRKKGTTTKNTHNTLTIFSKIKFKRSIFVELQNVSLPVGNLSIFLAIQINQLTCDVFILYVICFALSFFGRILFARTSLDIQNVRREGKKRF